MNYNEAYNKLNSFNQIHVLKYYNELNDKEKELLLNQIDKIDLSILNVKKNSNNEKEIISPIKTLTIDEIKKEETNYYNYGIDLLNKGKIACVLLAGGMGTRLGSKDPKGMFKVGINNNLSIFECQINTLKKISTKCNNTIYLFIMTSPQNNNQTIRFFESNNYFGYDKNHIKFFIQDEAPITDNNDKLLLFNKYTVATSPNGNGGWYKSLYSQGLVDFMKSVGIEYLNVYGVDNVLQYMADPVFVGATISNNFECGAKVIKKASPEEKVGVITLTNGHPSVTDYAELNDDMRYAKDDNGNYLYYYGVILNYLFKLDSLNKTLGDNFPLHKAFKKVNYMNINGEFIEALEPNAYKTEIFITDMIKMMNNCLSFEVEREKEFAPIKNLHGVDSVDSARELLKKNGIEL